mgnify:CR=1 FL=1
MTFIIAEAGVNHNGDYRTAWQLCGDAKKAGADAVKFQLFSSQKLWGDDRIKHLELSEAQLTNLAWHCKDIDIEFLCTPFDADAVRFLNPLVKRMKIASGCINRWEILDAIDPKLPVLLSTGMSRWDEIRAAVNRLDNPLTLLHCTSIYPCPPEQVNLTAMQTLSEFGYPVGFSDHTDNEFCAVVAVGLGATVIEKHMTLDRTQDGPDHLSSVDPVTFHRMVAAIRYVEKALGDGVKVVQPGEIELRKAWR